MAFQDRLIELRKEKGYSQETLSEEISVSPKTVSRWESGKADPTLRDLYALSEVLGVPLEELIRKEGAVSAQESAAGENSSEKVIEYIKAEKALANKRRSLVLIVGLGLLGIVFAIVSACEYIYYYLHNQPPVDGDIVLWEENVGVFNRPEFFLWLAVLFLLIGGIILFIKYREKRGEKNEERK